MPWPRECAARRVVAVVGSHPRALVHAHVRDRGMLRSLSAACEAPETVSPWAEALHVLAMHAIPAHTGLG